jgi:ADP-ribose pyrophosphatase YjhB (NUDIX family)
VKVRVTGVMVEEERILVLRQRAGLRTYSLPGGTLEEGETLAEALVREMREETGLEVEPGRLLYLCDYLPDSKTHVVHVTFEVRRTGGVLGDVKAGADTTPILGVEFVNIADLPSLGFTERFCELAESGFPGAGSYAGAKSGIGL